MKDFTQTYKKLHAFNCFRHDEKTLQTAQAKHVELF